MQDTYFGQTVTDPYRWLEDQKSAEAVQWMRAQADRTRALLDSMPGRGGLLAEIQNYENKGEYQTSDPHRVGDLLFFRRRARGANQSALCLRDASGKERKLFDPNSLTTPGHHVSLDSYVPFQSGRYVLLVLSADGLEQATGHILDVETGQELADRLPRVWKGLPISSDRDVYYVALEELRAGASSVDKLRRLRTVRHRIGTPNAEDEIVLGPGTSPDIPVADFTWGNSANGTLPLCARHSCPRSQHLS